MNRDRRYQGLLAGFFLALVASLLYIAHLKQEIFMWKDSTYMLSKNLGIVDAAREFRQGKRRIFVLNGYNIEDKYIGKNEGPFEVWETRYLPDLGESERTDRKGYTEGYNARMKSDYQKQEK